MFGLLGSALVVAVGGIGLLGGFRGSAPAVPGAFATPARVPTVTAAPTGEPALAVPAPSQSSVVRSVMGVHPTGLRIPSIRVDTSMELLGLAPDGTLQTPSDPKEAGWFTGSSLPGEPGPVVIVGHIDSLTGPAVFVYLRDLQDGAAITITLSDGSQVAYRVVSVVTYAKDDFPTESVYGSRPDSELRLITCGGAFVHGQYVDDVVVFAKQAAIA